MSYSFSQKDLKVLFSHKEKIINFSFPNNKGSVITQKKIVNENIYLSKSKMLTNDFLCVKHEEYDYNCLFIDIFLNGKMLIDNKMFEKNIKLEKTNCVIYLAREMEGKTHLNKNDDIQTLSLLIKKDFLVEYLPHLDKLDTTKLLKHTRTNPRTLTLAREIYNSPINEKLDELYLQSKVLEIIYHEFLSMNEKVKKEQVNFSSYDKKAIKHAEEIILSSINNPPSTKELSKMVHLNEFKLKFGFKKYFGSSIYKYLLSYKLNMAKKLLLEEELNISEVAKITGYKHLPSFSMAFKKQFGINPKDIKK